MLRLSHAPLRQMHTLGADHFRQVGIIGNKDGGDSAKLFGQSAPALPLAGAHDDEATARKRARGIDPVGRTVVRHQNQGQVRIETSLLIG